MPGIRTGNVNTDVRAAADGKRSTAVRLRNGKTVVKGAGAVKEPHAATVKGQRSYYDFSLLSTLIFIFAIGLLVIYSSSQYLAAQEHGSASYYFNRQLLIGGAGLIFAIAVSVLPLDYRWLRSGNGILGKAVYAFSLGLLLLTQVSGIASHGKTRWLEIAGASFQPTELAKIGLIVIISLIISKYGPEINKWKNWKKVVLWTLPPAALIASQNISSGFIVIMIAAIMLFVAMDNYKVFMGLLAAFLGAVLGLKPLLHQIIITAGITERPEHYALRRVFGWAAPEIFTTDAYQTQQAIYAIGSGGIFGHGLGDSLQKYGAIPEVQNDMIFSIVCEEFGFIGAMAIIIIYMYLLYRIYKIAVNANDLLGSMLCTGVMAHIGMQVALNIAVVTGVIPNTGVTLPFISYGGSAVFFTMCEMGLVLNVAHKIKV